MAYKITYTHTFGGLSSPIPLSYLDADYTNVSDAIASLNTFGNYYVDTGSVNAYAITLSTGQTATFLAGLPIQVKIANANTGASTLSINGGSAEPIKDQNGIALVAGQLASGGIYLLQCDGTNYQLLNPGPGVLAGSSQATKFFSATDTENMASSGSQTVNFSNGAVQFGIDSTWLCTIGVSENGSNYARRSFVVTMGSELDATAGVITDLGYKTKVTTIAAPTLTGTGPVYAQSTIVPTFAGSNAILTATRVA